MVFKKDLKKVVQADEHSCWKKKKKARTIEIWFVINTPELLELQCYSLH